MDRVDWSIEGRCTVRGVLFSCQCEDVLQLGKGSLWLTGEATGKEPFRGRAFGPRDETGLEGNGDEINPTCGVALKHINGR